MAFVGEDEHIILMDPPGPLVTCGEAGAWTNTHWTRPEDLVKLRDVGIKTAWATVWWNEIEREAGVRDWSHVDQAVERVTGAGLKLLLNTYHHPPYPGVLPREWYQRFANLHTCGFFSFQNEQAQAYEHAFIKEICARYPADMVKCINCLQCDGETLTQLEAYWYDNAGLASRYPDFPEGVAYACAAAQQLPPDVDSEETQAWLRHWVIKTMLDQHDAFGGDEMWFGLHPQIVYPASGNQFMDDIYRAFREQKPDVSLWLLQYTYFPHGIPYRTKIREMIREHGLHVFGGAEYCTGLDVNTNFAIEDGVGFLLGATHPGSGKTRVDDRMLGSIKMALHNMREAR